MKITKITVFTKPKCVQCEYTKKQLDKFEIDYEDIDVTEQEWARQHLKDLGRTTMPVVVVERNGQPPGVWEGFRLSRIRGLIQEYHSQEESRNCENHSQDDHSA